MNPENPFQSSRYKLRPRSKPQIPPQSVKPLRRTTADKSKAQKEIDNSDISLLSFIDENEKEEEHRNISKAPEPSANSDSEIEGEIIEPEFPLPFDGKLDFTPSTPQTGLSIPSALALLFFSISIFSYLVWFRFHTLKLGYCDGSQPEMDRNHLNFFRPRCWPCPAHGICFKRKLFCKTGYVLVKDPFDSELFPLPSNCHPNKKISQKIELLSTYAVTLLQKKLGNFRCHSSEKSKGLTSKELYDELFEAKKVFTTLKEFEIITSSVFERLKVWPDKVNFSKLKIDGSDEYFFFATIPEYTFTCKVKVLIMDELTKYYKELIFFITIILTFIILKRKYLKYNAQIRMIKKAANKALLALVEKDHLSRTNPQLYSDSSVSVTQLRDRLLGRKYPIIKQRIVVWDKVVEIVEDNTNIRTSQRERNGDLHKVWEWVGDPL